MPPASSLDTDTKLKSTLPHRRRFCLDAPVRGTSASRQQHGRVDCASAFVKLRWQQLRLLFYCVTPERQIELAPPPTLSTLAGIDFDLRLRLLLPRSVPESTPASGFCLRHHLATSPLHMALSLGFAASGTPRVDSASCSIRPRRCQSLVLTLPSDTCP